MQRTVAKITGYVTLINLQPEGEMPMLWGAQNGSVKIGNTEMEYITFGRGQETLMMIPGLGDGLKTVKGTAAVMAMLYREYCKSYKVYVFSRKNIIEEGYSIRDMAADLRDAMEKLGIAKAHVVGVSQGGMIAQCLAVDYPSAVDKLILVVTIARPNETVKRVVSAWVDLAASNDYRSLFIDTIEKSYTENYRKRYRRLYPLLTRIGKPKDFSRFIIQAHASLQHDAYAELERISCPTLVIGANMDEIVGAQASREIAEQITGSKLLIYEAFGHGVYEEAKDFNKQIMDFLHSESSSLM